MSQTIKIIIILLLLILIFILSKNKSIDYFSPCAAPQQNSQLSVTITPNPAPTTIIDDNMRMIVTFSCKTLTTPYAVYLPEDLYNQYKLSAFGNSDTIFTFLWNPTSTTYPISKRPTTGVYFYFVSDADGDITSPMVTFTDSPCTGTTLMITPTTVTVGYLTFMEVIFTCQQTNTLALSINNTSIQLEYQASNDYTFSWTPTSPGSTTLIFTGVTGVTDGTSSISTQITVNAAGPCTGTTVTITPPPAGITVGSLIGITATFTCQQKNTPVLKINNTAIPLMPYTGYNNYFFTWTPTSPGSTTLNFTNVTGVTGVTDDTGSISTTITVNAAGSIPCTGTTVTITPTTGITVGSLTNMTATFTCSQTSALALSINNTSIPLNPSTGNSYTFGWTPTSPGSTTLIFTNVTGVTDDTGSISTTITVNAAGSIPCTGTTVTITPTTGITVGSLTNMTATFTCSQTSALALSINNTSIPLNPSTGNSYTFGWTPTSPGSTTLIFTNVTGVTDDTGSISTTITVNAAGSIPCTGTTVTITPTTGITVGSLTNMTATFTCSQTSALALSINNTSIPLNPSTGNSYTFGWTPTSPGSTTLIFTNVTGVTDDTGSISTTITVNAAGSIPCTGTTVTITPTTGITVGSLTNMTATFTCSQTSALALSINNTSIPLNPSTGNSYTFGWTPTSPGSTTLIFTNVTGVTGTDFISTQITVNAAGSIPPSPTPAPAPKSTPTPEEVTHYNFIQNLYYNHNVYFILIVTGGSVIIVIFIIIILYLIFRHKNTNNNYNI